MFIVSDSNLKTPCEHQNSKQKKKTLGAKASKNIDQKLIERATDQEE